MATTDYKHILPALVLVESILPDYKLLLRAPDGHVVSVDYFFEFCLSRASIEAYEHPTHTYTGALPRGKYISNDDGTYEIIILPGQKFCWNRFVLCKELFHVLLDVEDKQRIFAHNDVDAHLEKYMYEDSPDSSPLNVQSEWLAEFAAMEFLFPHAHRAKQIDVDSAVLAERYKVPKQKVEEYMRPKYIEMLDPEFIKKAA